MRMMRKYGLSYTTTLSISETATRRSSSVTFTINGKEGGFQNGVFVTFTYPEGDKLVSIFAPDEDTVGKIVGS